MNGFCTVMEQPSTLKYTYKWRVCGKTAAVCPGFTIPHCSKTDVEEVEEIKATIDNS